jgi:hypothetical protein
LKIDINISPPPPLMILVITKCDQCPLCVKTTTERMCNVATPPRRPIHDDAVRPTWCPLRKEQIVIRDFK